MNAPLNLQDDYLLSLARDLQKLQEGLLDAESREAAAAADKARIRAQLAPLQSTYDHYVSYLQEKGVLVAPPSDEEFENLKLRIGPKRLAVLTHIGKATLAKGQCRIGDVHRDTKIAYGVAYNVIWEDEKRGLLERVDAFVKMTPKGFEFLRRAGYPVEGGQ